MRISSPLLLIGLVALSLTSALHAQRPAVPGVTGTIVTEETARQEKKLADKAGAATKDLITREDTGPLSDLRPGMTLVIAYSLDRVTEAVLSKVDRGKKELTVRHGNGTIETLQLTDQKTTATVVYTPDVKGGKKTLYFKPKS